MTAVSPVDSNFCPSATKRRRVAEVINLAVENHDDRSPSTMGRAPAGEGQDEAA
jgi:hypothetical protein